MLISDEELEKRINNPENLISRPPLPTARRSNNDIAQRRNERAIEPEIVGDNCTIRPLHNGGRRPGDKNLPEFLRATIGAAARIDTLKNVSEVFDVSLHHAHELRHGKITNESGVDEKLADQINVKLKTPHDKAIDRLSKALDALTDEKIGAVKKAKDIAQIANTLASVADKTLPIQREGDEGGLKLIVYAPTLNTENNYESVHVAQGAQ